MKPVIFTVLLVLCFQLCRANSCYNCEDELAKLTANTETLVAKYKAASQDAQTIAQGTVHKQCPLLFAAEMNLMKGEFANKEDALCKARTFVEENNAFTKVFTDEFSKSECGWNTLQNLLKDFSKNNNLVCRRFVFGKGCEAALNSLRCALSTFITQAQSAAKKAQSNIKKLNCVITDLNKITEKFTKTTDLTGGSGCGCNENPTAKIVAFASDYNEAHWDGHYVMIELQRACDTALKLGSLLSSNYCNV
ncbi:uncharacterized protein LOC119085949 [Bradysia coprophila]|uniref:uncharacterized protein LOC119085949 n=1 Tax=Bradysia coprophila TaxID=38358 RepID=UPI00187DD72B|nr:uncharacterized protein LOC119085949 [Bradysia coprophila]